MRRTPSIPCCLIALAIPAYAGEPVGEMPQLMQLNRASQQELQRIQSSEGRDATAVSPERPWRKKSLDRSQQLEQRGLQEDQRRELLMEKQRAKASNKPGSQRRLDAIGRQRKFRAQQQNQLKRFRGQRRSGRR